MVLHRLKLKKVFLIDYSIENRKGTYHEKIKVFERYTDKQKAIKYSEWMTLLENVYHLPLLESDFSNVDEDVKSLYLELLKERKLYQ